MYDPVYAKLAFNEFHVEWNQMSNQGFNDIEIFDLNELVANGFDYIPTLDEFLKIAIFDWGGEIVEIKDRSGNVLYRDS